MALATSLRKTASKLMAKFGGDVIIRQITTGTYNTTTGAASVTASTTTVRGVLENVSEREVNDLIKGTDRKLTVAAVDLAAEPTVADQVTVNGRILQTVEVRRIEQDNTAIVYEIFLRE